MDYKQDWHTFWSDVKAARGRHRISQKKAGARYGVGGAAFGQWERKHRAMLGGQFMDMCYCFDLNPYAYYTVKIDPEWKQAKLIDVPHEAQEWPIDFQIPGWMTEEAANPEGVQGTMGIEESYYGEEVLDHDYSDQLNEDFLNDMEAY